MTVAAARTILVIGGGRDALPVLRVLRGLGHRVVVADGRPDAPGFHLADAGLLAATLDPEAAVEAARAYRSRTNVDAVIATHRRLALSAAAVAEVLGLPCTGVASAAGLLDRLAMRERLCERGVAVPPARRVSSPDDVRCAAETFGTPLLVRPVDGWAARGVVRLGSDVEPAWAFRVAATASPTGQVMCESFLSGRSLLVVALLAGDECLVLDVAERISESRFAPFVIAAGSQAPCALSAVARHGIERAVAAVAAALGLRDVLCTTELVVDGTHVAVVDVQVGLTDGRRLAHDIPLGSGLAPVEAALCVALGEPLDGEAVRRRWCRPVVEVALFPAPGRVVAVWAVEEAAAADGVALVDVAAEPGTRVGPPTSNLCRGGVVVATGVTLTDASASARAAAARIRIETESDAGRRDLPVH